MFVFVKSIFGAIIFIMYASRKFVFRSLVNCKFVFVKFCDEECGIFLLVCWCE